MLLAWERSIATRLASLVDQCCRAANKLWAREALLLDAEILREEREELAQAKAQLAMRETWEANTIANDARQLARALLSGSVRIDRQETRADREFSQEERLEFLSHLHRAHSRRFLGAWALLAEPAETADEVDRRWDAIITLEDERLAVSAIAGLEATSWPLVDLVGAP
jgi:hypothetical protein